MNGYGFVSTSTNYKLFNRLQVRYLANGSPTILNAQTAVGETINPCGAILGFLGIFAGQTGPSDQSGFVAGNNSRTVSINDGSPDAGAIRAFNTLMGKDLPPEQTAFFWENIGSKVTHRFNASLSGEVVVQPYPTYFIYLNGRLVSQVPQANAPTAHFYMFPYPFGTVSCLGVGGITPGGRCGDAVSPSDASARVPPSGYTLP